ncbi:MAG: ATP-binding cassette domain-containing protein [Candidatus Bathyarchaeales archaeon]
MIELRDVHKSYGAIQILSHINVKVGEKECLAVIGKSGSGKTTLLKIMGTLAMPDKGSVTIFGVDVTKAGREELVSIRRSIGFSFQQPLLLPYMSALENVMLASNIGKKEAIELLSFLGLNERINHGPKKLSEGEKKRVDLARALAKKPTILIADEPFSNLDINRIEKVSNLINNFTKNGGTAIISSTGEVKLLNITHVIQL